MGPPSWRMMGFIGVGGRRLRPHRADGTRPPPGPAPPPPKGAVGSDSSSGGSSSSSSSLVQGESPPGASHYCPFYSEWWSAVAGSSIRGNQQHPQ